MESKYASLNLFFLLSTISSMEALKTILSAVLDSLPSDVGHLEQTNAIQWQQGVIQVMNTSENSSMLNSEELTNKPSKANPTESKLNSDL